MGFTVDIKGNASHLDKTLKGVDKSLSNLGSVATTGLKSLAGIGIAGGAALTAFIVSSSNAASNIESLTMQFETLLGGADAAGKRMEEIVKFAASTPFEIQELAATSKLLQKMGGTLLATGDGLRMVGDASAIVGRPLEEIGLHIGRVFAAMTSGTSAGESVGRLQELGLITGDVKRELEALAAAQKKGTVEVLTSEKALAKLKGILSANEGAMARLAATTQGKLSNMKDNLSQLQVAFGTGFNEGLKIALDATNSFLPQMQQKFTDFGFYIGEAIKGGVDGNMEKLQAVGEVIGSAVGAGFQIGFEKIVMGTIEKVIVDYADLEESRGYNQRMKRKNAWMDKAVNATSEKDRDYYIKQANAISSKQPVFRENYNIGNAQQQSSAEKFAEAMRPSMNKMESLNVEAQIQNALKKGTLDTNMSKAVRDGVLEAWKTQGGAKFSN
jgi:hypothetical protein